MNQLASTMQTLGSLLPANIAGHPMVKLALKYWWVSVPVGMAFYGKMKERYEDATEKKPVQLHHWIVEAANVLTPVLTLVGLAELAERMDQEGRLGPAPVMPVAPLPVNAQIKDAEFKEIPS